MGEKLANLTLIGLIYYVMSRNPNLSKGKAINSLDMMPVASKSSVMGEGQLAYCPVLQLLTAMDTVFAPNTLTNL